MKLSRRQIALWMAIALSILASVIAAAFSPLLAWRQPIYIMAGFAGIAAMVFLLIQPFLIAANLSGLKPTLGRRVHKMIGGALVVSVLAHVVGLWLTSPPDVIDALLFSSPTPFSFWGVIAMWAVFSAALLAGLRRKLKLKPKTWRLAHGSLVAIIVVGSVVHAMLIEGTMETISKVALCFLAILLTAKVLVDLRLWTLLTSGRGKLPK